MNEQQYNQQQQQVTQRNDTLMFGYQSNQSQSKVWELDPTEIIKKLEKALLAIRYDPKLKSYVRIEGRKPLMNQEGFNMLMSITEPVLDKMTTLSNFDEEQINTNCRLYSLQVLNILTLSYKEFDLDPNHIEAVLGMLDRAVESSYRRAWRGMERESLRNTQSRSEISYADGRPMSKPQGFFQRVGGIFK